MRWLKESYRNWVQYVSIVFMHSSFAVDSATSNTWRMLKAEIATPLPTAVCLQKPEPEYCSVFSACYIIVYVVFLLAKISIPWYYFLKLEICNLSITGHMVDAISSNVDSMRSCLKSNLPGMVKLSIVVLPFNLCSSEKLCLIFPLLMKERINWFAMMPAV